MKENKEISEHIEAIGKWASQDKKRVAFVICGEIKADGIETSNSLVGRTDRIARVIFGNAMEEESFKQTTMLAAKMIENPLFATLFCMKASEDESSQSKSNLADAFKDLFGAITEKLRKDD